MLLTWLLRQLNNQFIPNYIIHLLEYINCTEVNKRIYEIDRLSVRLPK
jgi:hypothetical protein